MQGYYGRAEDDKMDRSLTALKWFNFLLFVVKFFLGLASFGICIWVRYGEGVRCLAFAMLSQNLKWQFSNLT